MDKLIITITSDSTMSFPGNPHNPTPKGLAEVAREYVRSIDAGAAISHLHGPYTQDKEIQPDGTRLSDLDIPAWGELRQKILDERDTIIQYGIANGKFQQRKQLLQEQKPDMVSVCHNAHDECFDYEPGNEPVELYGLHNREELIEYHKLCEPLGVKVECECFHLGGVWNAARMVEKGYAKKPVWITYFLGWRGGCWTPPTLRSMQHMHDHLPEGFNYNTSVMDPDEHWRVLAMAIMLGGHVRVGMEDNPFITPGEYAKSNAELVEKIVRIARELGRDIATSDEARKIIGLA